MNAVDARAVDCEAWEFGHRFVVTVCGHRNKVRGAADVDAGGVGAYFELPVVLSTVYVKHGMSGTNAELLATPPGVSEIDRTTLNSWEHPEFRAAVERTGRKKLVIAGLRTEVCVAFPTLDALGAGYQVYVVADAIGGVSRVAHDSAMQRMIQAGALPISVLGLACELQRDWGRPEANRLRAMMREYFANRRTRPQ